MGSKRRKGRGRDLQLEGLGTEKGRKKTSGAVAYGL